MSEKYRYEGVAGVGDRVRSYDFRGNPDCYIEGRVLRLDRDGKEKGFAAFVVLCDRDVWYGKTPPWRTGQTVYVPMEVAWGEYDGRVVNLGRAAAV
jgi:hypothetical protein